MGPDSRKEWGTAVSRKGIAAAKNYEFGAAVRFRPLHEFTVFLLCVVSHIGKTLHKMKAQ